MRTDPSSVESTLLSSLKLSTCAFARQGEGISRSCVAASIPNPLLLKILAFSLAQLATSRRWVSQNQVPDFLSHNNCCDDYRHHASKESRKDTHHEHTGYTANCNHHLEHRPGSLCCRVQGQAHDDLQREGAIRQSLRTLDSGRIRADKLSCRGLDRSSLDRDARAQRDAHLKSADFLHVEKF